MQERVDVAVVGAGAAGLMAAIWAGRAGARVVAVDGARTIGAKILVAGGGRCNVTHHAVREQDYAGSTAGAIRAVLRRFDVRRTVEFFAELGVELKREETGKLFPVTDRARTVLEALLGAARQAGAEVVHPWRVGSVRVAGDGFVIARSDAAGEMRARRVVMATGGMALPRSGSDGAGYGVVRSLGHTVTERVFPALVPLVVEERFVHELSGLSVRATVEVRAGSGRKLASFTNSTLCTHFGLSGPSVLDASRYYLDARGRDEGAHVRINWSPGRSLEEVDELLVSRRGVSPARVLSGAPIGLPERLSRALCAQAGVEASATGEHVSRERRRALAATVTEMRVAVTGDRGFAHAEATAGGVPLSEVELETMESKVCPGLHICGEVCDVDGRIGGFNFQWAWSSGQVAGSAAGRLTTTA
ncbi:MAG: NAD(P)/FAD-dependent oxidoreductase [Phycisphaerales bacterium]